MLMSNQRPNRLLADELFGVAEPSDSFQLFSDSVQPCLRDDALTEIMDCKDYYFPTASDDSLHAMPSSQPALGNPPAYNEVVKHENLMSQPASPEDHKRLRKIPATRRRPKEKLPERHKSGQYADIKNDAGKIQEDYISDEEERKRVLEKREKNRAAAAKARKRKQNQLENLENEKQKLQSAINKAIDEVREAQTLRNTLRTIFDEHDRVCAYRQIHFDLQH